VTGFPEFPNTSPSGKRVDSDDPIPRTFRKFSKKRHPRNVGGNTRHPKTPQRSNRGRFHGTTPPLAPINRRLSLLKNLTALILSSEFWLSAFAEKNLANERLEIQAFLRTFDGNGFSTFRSLFQLFVVLVFLFCEFAFTNAILLLSTKVILVVFTHIFVE
jgi:hypothetical protein